MTDLLQRPSPPARPTDRVPPPAWLSGLAAGLVAAGAGVVGCMGLAVAGWLTGSTGTMSDALRVGVGGWLLAHGHALEAGPATITLVPLGLTALLVAMLVAATAGATRMAGVQDRRSALAVAAAAAASYATVVAALAAGTSVEPVGVGRAAVGTALVALTGTGAGALRGSSGFRLPRLLVATARAAAVGVLIVCGCAALTIALSLIVHVESLEQVVGSLRLSLAGGLALVIASALLLPNIVLLTAAVMLGPGVALGTGSSITLTEVSVTSLPAVPWLAAVPQAGTQPVPLAALAALPAVAGIVAGVVVVRRLACGGVLVAAGRGLLAGGLAGALLGGGIAAGGGAAGPGRMSDIGASAPLCLAVAVVVLGVGGVLGAVVTQLLGRRRG